MPESAVMPIAPGTTSRPRVGRALVVATLVLGATAASGIVTRRGSEASLARWTDQQAVPSVRLVSPEPATQVQHLDLPASVRAFYEAPIRARVSGYVKMWYADIGAHVRAGQVLATIESPELDQQYERAKGELARAQAGYALAALTADRWKTLRASQAVSQQTADEKASDAQARKAEVAAAQAHVDQLKAMEDYKNIEAPFDGIVTARDVDVGALVSSGDASAKSLFRVAATKRMRVYVEVPQVSSAPIRKGLPLTLTLPQYPDRVFKGLVETTSDAIGLDSRALEIEAILSNPDGLLSPGAYAQAHFALPLDPYKLAIPSSALIFKGESPEVAVVRGGTVTLTSIKIAVDLGATIEITSGLAPADRIVDSPSDSIETGDKIVVANRPGRDGQDPQADAADDRSVRPGGIAEARR